MILSEKIILLRKQNNFTQEELAEKLNVSRQSVSKWEMGASIPEINKIILMSEIFGVNTDYLLKDNIEQISYSDDEEKLCGKTIVLEEANEFIEIRIERSKKLSLSIFMFIFAAVPLMFLLGLSELGTLSEDMAIIVGICSILILVAIGVFRLVVSEYIIDKYKDLETDDFNLAYGVKGLIEKKKSENQPIASKIKAMAIFLFIIASIPLIIFTNLEINEGYILIAVGLLLILIAIGVSILIRYIAIEEACNILLQEGDYKSIEKKISKKLETFNLAYWLIITAIYLAISFLTMKWDMTWIIYSVSGVVFAALTIILRSKIKKELEQ